MIRRHPYRTIFVVVPFVTAIAFGSLMALWLAGVQVPGASAQRWFTLTKTAVADYTPTTNEPIFILAIGNDGRTGDTVTRGDAIHLIGINPGLHQGTMLDFPATRGWRFPATAWTR